MSELINKDPMTVGKILDKAVNFIFRNILWIALIGFLILLPGLLWNQWMSSEDSNNQFARLARLKYNLILQLISWVLSPLLAGTVTILLGEHFCGRKIPWYQGFGKSIKKWFPLVLLLLVVGTLVVLGSFLFIIPGIMVMCATACAIPAMMLEDLSPIKAFKRSCGLTKNSRFRIFGYFIFCLIPPIVGGIAALILETMPMDPLYKVGITALVLAPTQALWPAISTLLFYDLRIRKEAMDLEEEANMISVATEEIA